MDEIKGRKFKNFKEFVEFLKERFWKEEQEKVDKDEEAFLKEAGEL